LSIVPDGCGFTLQNRGHNFCTDRDHPNCIEGGKRPYHTIIPGMATVDFEGTGQDRQDGTGRTGQTGDAVEGSQQSAASAAHPGHLYASFGVMGGFMQPQGHLQVISNMVDFGMDPQQALDAPRICIDAEGLHDPASALPQLGPVSFEEGISEETIQTLKDMGHHIVGTTVKDGVALEGRGKPVRGYKRSLFGKGQIICPKVSGPALAAGGASMTGDRVLWGGSDGRADGCAGGTASF
jgi:gamma-glutamyltranspeptidase/glutathione hydrolase